MASLLEFDQYKDRFKTIRMERDARGVLTMTLHHEGGPYRWGGEAIHQEMSQAAALVSRDEANRIVIITGTGEWFSGPQATEKTMTRGDARHWDRARAQAGAMLHGLLDIPGPVISCINGPAYRHCEIPLLADVVLAAPDACIQDSAHFPGGKVPGDGIALVLGYLLGPRARYWHLTGQIIEAERLLDLGVVHEIHPREELLPRAHRLADQFLQNHPMVLRYTRAAMVAPLKQLLNEHLDHQFVLEALAGLAESAEHLGFSWDEESR